MRPKSAFQEIGMTDGFKAPPISGYQDVSGDKAAFVNANKELEERILRRIDGMTDASLAIDQRWLAIARTHIEQGFMAMNRAVFQPTRINLPEDQTN